MTLEKMEELQDIIEDYINLAQSRHFVVEEDLSSYMEKMRDHWATLVEYIDKELQKAREEKQNILTVGWHKGEMDFGINCDIDELDIKQMHEFRVMVCVAIGQAENMWRRAREKQNPAAVNNLSDQSELDQPISQDNK